MKQVYLSYYATPMLVGALCNIMPSSVPTALLHDLSRMLFSKLMTIHSDWMNLLFTSQPLSTYLQTIHSQRMSLQHYLTAFKVIRGCADKEEEPPSSPGHRLPIGDKKSSQECLNITALPGPPSGTCFW
ncbi:uncharacterized protein LOC144113358 isoform X3 [Amblyomma americanum]